MERTGDGRNSKVRIGNILLVLQVAAILLIAFSLGTYLWSVTGIGEVDPSLQVLFLAVMVLASAFATNHLLDRRW